MLMDRYGALRELKRISIPGRGCGPGDVHKPFFKAGQVLDLGFQGPQLFCSQLDIGWIGSGEQFDHWMLSFPSHCPGKVESGIYLIQQITVPVVL